MVLGYKVLAFLRLSAIANPMMSPPMEYEPLLETRRNGSLYCLYKLGTMPEENDTRAITYLISTIESFLRSTSKISSVFSRMTVSDTFLEIGEYACLQIVAPKGTIPKDKCMYWAEGSDLATGTMVLRKNEELPYDKANTYGDFNAYIYSTCSRTSFRDYNNNLLFRICHDHA
jgi:hypothetical protein